MFLEDALTYRQELNTQVGTGQAVKTKVESIFLKGEEWKELIIQAIL